MGRTNDLECYCAECAELIVAQLATHRRKEEEKLNFE